MAKEPCSRCSEETGVGSAWFSDRHMIENPDGGLTFLCPLCDPRLRASRRGRRPTADEVRNLTQNGSAAGITWGGPGGFTPLG